MSEKLEHVARALCQEDGHDPDGDDCWNFGRSHEVKRKNWEAYLGGARVAVEAMREPTEAMYTAIREMTSLKSGDVNEIWHAGIDEALK